MKKQHKLNKLNKETKANLFVIATVIIMFTAWFVLALQMIYPSSW